MQNFVILAHSGLCFFSSPPLRTEWFGNQTAHIFCLNITSDKEIMTLVAVVICTRQFEETLTNYCLIIFYAGT